jgi:hypothetical protein
MGKVPGMPQTNPTQSARSTSLLMPIAGRAMEVRALTRAADGDTKAPLATAEIVFTSGAQVARYDWQRDRMYMEELSVEPGAIRLERLQRGAPLLNTHGSYDLDQILGVVENPIIANGLGVCTATFSRREGVAGYVQDVEDKIIRNVSVGYVRHKLEMIAPVTDGAPWVYRVTDWEPMEVSLVPIPADMDSQIRAAGTDSKPSEHQLRQFACECIETRSAGAQPVAATQATPTVGITAESSTRKETSMPGIQAADGNNAPANVSPAASPAAVAPDTRAADIADLCVRHGVPALASALIRDGSTAEQAGLAVLNELSRRDAESGGHRNVVRITTERDEMSVRMAGIEQAILHRVASGTVLDDNGRQYRGLSLIEMGRDFLEAHGQNTRGLDRMTLASRMLNFRVAGPMGTTDFSSLFASVANRRLRSAYDENAGTYAMWARRAPNAPDFKNMSIVQLAGAPDLLKTNEAGEFKYGAMSDGGETYAMLTYGRIVSLTRQAIVNDDLRAFERMVSAFGFAARRLENRTVYAQLTANANLADGVALFHATHNNLLASSALAIATLGAGRTAMRLQKGLQSEELNLSPSYLIVPASLEQTAYQLTSSNYVPSAKAEVNEFRTGGRTAVTPIVEPVLDANSPTSWYLAANSSQVDTVEYCYLDGAEGPVIESEVGFETDGVSYKCRLDFAAKAVDHRGMVKANA